MESIDKDIELEIFKQAPAKSDNPMENVLRECFSVDILVNSKF